MLRPPVLSLLDLDTDGEGSIDPLSLQPVYERLANRILPAVTARMSRIRFVTAMCVGARVCRDLDPDLVAKDGITPPWLVFEWFVVEAFVRRREDLDDMSRIPGARKVEGCIRKKRPVSHAAYLKTPQVFGFSGIFRRLATRLGILTEDLELDEVGHQLVRAWECDQGLDGFVAGSESGDGPGISLRKRMRNAVVTGLDAGTTVPRPIDFWSEVAARLQPGRLGKREKKVLFDALRGDGLGEDARKAGFAAELVDALIDRGVTIERDAESGFLRRLIRKGSQDLATHLSAIEAYERLCTPVVAAFDLVRYLSTTTGFGPVTADGFARHALAPRLVKLLVDGRKAVEGDPKLLEWEPEVRLLLDSFGEIRSAGDLFHSVVKHHQRAQIDKPPEGKRPWMEEWEGNKVRLRTPYPKEEPPTIGEAYVHDYRIPTLSRFLRDLGRVS